MTQQVTKLFTLILFAAFVLVYAGSCKKKKTEPVPTEDTTKDAPDFTYTGYQYVFSPITFYSNFKEKTQLTWYFGDNTEENIVGTEISHTYNAPGTYKVDMSVVDGFGGTATQFIKITSGTERIAGTYKWNFLLYTVKNGKVNGIPNKTFTMNMSLDISGDSTILIPDIPQLPYRGPYTVKLKKLTPNDFYFESDDGNSNLGFDYGNFNCGIEIKQVRNDTTWRVNGSATIIK